jgi:triosephosphate isomerase
MRRAFIAGNWKMNLTRDAASELARAVRPVAERTPEVDVALAPTYTALDVVIEALAGGPVATAAQNCHWEEAGAFTGEVSAEMVRDIGCSHVILGHSERRQLFGETDETVNKRVHAAHRAGLLPIVCIGETLEQREADQTSEVVARQLRGALDGVEPARMPALTVAYEPVWAIGTGKTATPGQAQAVHAELRALLGELYSSQVAEEVRIQYGGSVKPDNVAELMAQPDIDGALVGGASLKADSFAALIEFQKR